MSEVLTVQSTVSCPHQGKVTVPIPSQARLRVGGLSVLVSGVTFPPISDCKTRTSVPSGTTQCLAVKTVTGGQAPKLSVGGTPVLLETLAGTTTGLTPTEPTGPVLSAAAGQTRLRTAGA
jgi:hypothetical protein